MYSVYVGRYMNKNKINCIQYPLDQYCMCNVFYIPVITVTAVLHFFFNFVLVRNTCVNEKINYNLFEFLGS